jgi:hypothetical protein
MCAFFRENVEKENFSSQLVQLGRSGRYRPEISTVCTTAQLCVHFLCASTAVCTFAQYSLVLEY